MVHLLTITLQGHTNWYQSFLPADGLDGNGLQLENIGQCFQVPTVNFEETAKNLLIVYSSAAKPFHIFFPVP